jgi:hypothetical protein
MIGNGPRQFESGELEVPLSETQELELASELLEVSSEQELEQFLGNVFHAVGNALGQFVRSDTGQALGGILKDAAKKALPVVGRAIGERIAPGQGGEWGGQLAQAAGATLGLELEGLSAQDQEFEAARQFVRLAGAAANQAVLAPPASSPDETARHAAAAAAERFAPGLAQEIGHGWRQPMRRGYGARSGAGRRYPYPRQPSGPGARHSGGARSRMRHGAAWERSWQRGYQPYRYGAGQRPWQPGMQRPWRPGMQRPWQPGMQRPWQPGMQRPWLPGGPRAGQPGYGTFQYGSQSPDAGGWFDDTQPWPGRASQGGAAPSIQIEGSVDWSRPLHFYGRTPPQAPPGAPGRWVYRGLRRRRRLWRWVPFPTTTPFWSSVPAAYAPAPPADAPGEPGPPPVAPNGAAPMPDAGPTPTFEPAPVGAPSLPPAAPPNGAAQPDAGGQTMAPGPGDQTPHNGTAPPAPQGT